MEIINSLIEAIKEHDILSLWIIAIVVVTAILWNFPRSRHKRYLYRIIVWGLLLGVVGTFFFLSFFSWQMLIFLLDWWIISLAIALHSATKPVFPETISISHLKNLVRAGRYTEIEIRYPRKPFCIRSIPGKIKWELLIAKNLIERESPRFRDAYEVYANLLKYPLFDKESNNLRLKQVLVLLLLGDTNKAKSVFKEVKEFVDRDRLYEVLSLQSMFDERTGEFEKARHSLISATDEHDNDKNIQIARIYNNLGRMEGILGNTVNTLHYYRKSAILAGNLKEKNLIHIAYPNLIDTYLLNDDKKNADLFLDEYTRLIDKDNIDDLLRFNNYLLIYSRQINDNAFFLDILTNVRIEILPKISHEQRLIFEISELRIRWSSRYEWDKKIFWMKDHLYEYLELTFPARYLALKEIFNILRELANLGPFRNMFSQILNYMGESKTDIEQHILDLPDYCVYKRYFWENELAFLRKIQRTEEPCTNLIDFYERMFEHLSNIKDIQVEHGNPLPSITADLNIADECMGVIRGILEKPVIDYLLKKMQKHLDDACKNLGKFRWHPDSSEYVVRIAMYALFLGDKERSKEYFDEFIRSGISINHYARWIQSYFSDLQREFGKKPD